VIHDLKNLAYTFSLMMENAEEHIAEADFQKDLFTSIRSTVGNMNNLIVKAEVTPPQAGTADRSRRRRGTGPGDGAEVGKLKPAVTNLRGVRHGPGDPRRARDEKVVLNLLLNACDASGDGGRLTVRTGRRDGDVFLSVEDNGCGMSPSFIESQLFRPFRTTKEKGLGIGLYQCKQIVDAHGGRIAVESREGEGTMFTVVLPMAAQQTVLKAHSADRSYTASRTGRA